MIVNIASQLSEKDRIAWVDIAKGICIVLVVMMHSTLGVEKAVGAESGLHGFIEWARPFRMPDFFFISGLFLAARINRPWMSYLDTKVVHFAYFYVLWLTIQIGLRFAGLVDEKGFAGAATFYLLSYVEPYGTLWFIYMLAVFFVAAKLLQPLPRAVTFALAVATYLALPDTGYLVVDEFADRFVYFFAGYWAAPHVFTFAANLSRLHRSSLVAGLVIWAALNGMAVTTGLATVPGLNLLAGFIGVGAVISTAVLLVPSRLGQLFRYCGSNSISIYLAFSVFMATTRVVLLKAPLDIPPEAIALASTFAGIAGSLLLASAVRGTRLGFLFARPNLFRLNTSPRAAAQPSPAADRTGASAA